MMKEIGFFAIAIPVIGLIMSIIMRFIIGVDAVEKIIQGDFSVRVKPQSKLGTDETFNRVIDCFNKMAEELGSVETLRTDFIANVSHEMKTPLAVMQNYGTLLQAPDLTEEKRIEYVKGVTDSSRRLADMMTNILKLNRLENQQIYPQFSEFDLGEQLCECLLQYENVWEKAEIDIDTDIAENITVPYIPHLRLSNNRRLFYRRLLTFQQVCGILVEVSTSQTRYLTK